MPTSRSFDPSYVTALGPYFLAVDRVQPVLVAVSISGVVVDIASWGDSAPLPASSPWPNRRFAVDGDRLFVQDLPAEPVVAASIRDDGSIVVDSGSAFPGQGGVYRRLWTAPPVRDGEVDARWRFRSQLDRTFWSADVSFDKSSVHFESPASIVSRATHGATAAVCLQRENKRPFPLRPASEMHLLKAGKHGLVDLAVEELDISARCWQPTADWPRTQRNLADYLSFSLGDLAVLEQFGAHDAEVIVRGVGLSTAVETRFRLVEFPTTVFRRHDVPFDELGHLCGLRDMGVLLDEDLNGSGLAGWLGATTAELVTL